MTFRVPKIKSCLCFSLATGTKIIAVLHLLVVALALILPLIVYHVIDMQALVAETLILNMGCFAAIMLYGAMNNDYKMIFPWILFQTMYLVIFVIILVSDMAYIGLMDQVAEGMPIRLILSVLHGLSLLVVYNFYRELKGSTSEDF